MFRKVEVPNSSERAPPEGEDTAEAVDEQRHARHYIYTGHGVTNTQKEQYKRNDTYMEHKAHKPEN